MQNRESSRCLYKMQLCSLGCVWIVFGVYIEGLRLCKRQQWWCTSMHRRGKIFGLSSEMCTVTGLLWAFLPVGIISKSPFHILRESEVYLDFFIFLGELLFWVSVAAPAETVHHINLSPVLGFRLPCSVSQMFEPMFCLCTMYLWKWHM